MEQVTTQEGETVFVASDEAERGSKGVFNVLNKSPDRAERYGYYCSNCETINNAMDSMGRIVCNNCANMRQADEWDAAHE
jgi:hypothetical protein